MHLLPSDAINSIVSDPTLISAGTLGLSDTQTAAAILAYSKQPMYSSVTLSPQSAVLTTSNKAHGIRNIYYLMIPCCCISLFATLLFVRGHSLKRDDDAKLQEEGRQWAAKHKGLLHRKGRAASMDTSMEEVPPAVSREKTTASDDKHRS